MYSIKKNQMSSKIMINHESNRQQNLSYIIAI